MNEAVVFRAGRPEDVPAVHRALLDLAIALEMPGRIESSPEDLLRAGFGPEPLYRVTLAEVGEILAGLCIHFPYFSTWMGRPGVYVQDLFVAPAYRSAGIGERLLREVARGALQRGDAHMRLAVDESNERGAAFYLRLGFSAAPEEQVYKLTGDAFVHLAGSGAPD